MVPFKTCNDFTLRNSLLFGSPFQALLKVFSNKTFESAELCALSASRMFLKTFQNSITSSLNLDHNICCACHPFYYIRPDPAERSAVKPHLCSSLWKSLTFSFWFSERHLSRRSKLCGTCRLGNRWVLINFGGCTKIARQP